MNQTQGIRANEKPVENDFSYVYAENKDKGFIKVTKAMMKVLLGVATNLSELVNDKGFVDNTVSDLKNYYLKTETYSKEELDDKLSLVPRFSVQVVNSLPTENISDTTVYLVPSDEDEDNLYTEYIYVNGLWEILGTQKSNANIEIDSYLDQYSTNPVENRVVTKQLQYVKDDIDYMYKVADQVVGYGDVDTIIIDESLKDFTNVDDTYYKISDKVLTENDFEYGVKIQSSQTEFLISKEDIDFYDDGLVVVNIAGSDEFETWRIPVAFVIPYDNYNYEAGNVVFPHKGIWTLYLISDKNTSVTIPNSKAFKGFLVKGDFVYFSPQTLTEEAQAQARKNIGAASAKEVSELSDTIADLEEQIEDLGDDDSTVEKIVTKTFTINENEWDSTISFRHIWYPFIANQDFTIKNVSFKAKVNNGWVDSSQNMRVELLQADASTIISLGSCKYEWVDNNTLCNFDIDLNGEVKKGKVYYLHIYCTTRSFSFRNTGLNVTFANEWLTTQCPAITSNAGNAVFDPTINNPSMTLCCDMTIEAVVTEKVIEVAEIELLVSQEYSAKDEGFGETKFNTLLDAYESIPYSNSVKYVINVADGTYTDMQTLYAGIDGTTYQGIVLGKNGRKNVVFQSISNDPTKCIIEWDGGTGYTSELTNANVVNKTAFHINGGVGWEIRGFKFVGKNLRYCLHSETNSKTSCLIDNCIFEWNGKDCTDYNHKGPVVGMGGTYCNSITFKKCQFFNSENTLAVQWHDNKPYIDEDFLTGAILRFEDCYFDGLDIMPRSTEANRNMPFSLELVRCGGLRKIYPNIGGSATANYWRATVESCLIEDDKFKDCNSTTTFTDLTELKE